MHHTLLFSSSAFLRTETTVCVVVLVAWTAVLEVVASEAGGCLSVAALLEAWAAVLKVSASGAGEWHDGRGVRRWLWRSVYV